MADKTVVTSPGPSHFIVVSEDGPSTHPKQHSTYVKAADEAARLAKLYPGKVFRVYWAGAEVVAKQTSVKGFEYWNVYRGLIGRPETGPFGYQTEEAAKRAAMGSTGYLSTVAIPKEVSGPPEVTASVKDFWAQFQHDSNQDIPF